ncbi:MAG: hypothetical protein ACJAZ9_001149 [Neolewinella sp.]|jgi:hypothetical protein
MFVLLEGLVEGKRAGGEKITATALWATEAKDGR